jgi:hypothetical protein
MEAIAAHDPDRAYHAALAHLDHSEARLREEHPKLMAEGMNGTAIGQPTAPGSP